MLVIYFIYVNYLSVHRLIKFNWGTKKGKALWATCIGFLLTFLEPRAHKGIVYRITNYTSLCG